MGNVGMRLRPPSRLFSLPMHSFDLNSISLADDSGFFSVGVIEKALQVVGLRLVRWESQDMQPYHNNPEHQSAFVFNFKQHWFCMRKFGDSPDFWFNLNSFFDKPGPCSLLLSIRD